MCSPVKMLKAASIRQDERRSRQQGPENNDVRCILGVNSAPSSNSSTTSSSSSSSSSGGGGGGGSSSSSIPANSHALCVSLTPAD